MPIHPAQQPFSGPNDSRLDVEFVAPNAPAFLHSANYHIFFLSQRVERVHFFRSRALKPCHRQFWEKNEFLDKLVESLSTILPILDAAREACCRLSPLQAQPLLVKGGCGAGTNQGRAMSSIPLRIYYGPQSDPNATVSTEEGEARRAVTLSLGEILPLLAEAVQSQRTWLQDFDDDQVTISMDLYEVLLAYQFYRRPTA
jgi:hypothetical protein